MLDKLAEIVREGRRNIPDNFCVFCPPDKRCKLSECPNSDDENSLMLVRWAVLLVAKGLEKLPEAKIEDLKERKRIEGMPTAEYMCAMSNLGINFLNLLSEAIISERADAKEVKLDV